MAESTWSLLLLCFFELLNCNMKYSRNKINLAGKELIAVASDIFAYAEAITMVEDWRKLHLPVLESLTREVSEAFAGAGIPVAFSSQRLKRMTSIKDKLLRTPGMGLGGVQDLGGARYVFDDVPTMLTAKDCLDKAVLPSFELDHAPYDYVSVPKPSGYRSIHYVYKYRSSNSDLDGMRVELQIRTRLQHDWATAVETAELISKSQLKAGLGDENWLDFFRLVSAIFARQEGTAVEKSYADYDQAYFCHQYAAYNEQYKFIETLKALVGLVDTAEDQSFQGGYVVVLIEYASKTIQMRHFQPDEKERANEVYAQIESTIKKDEGAVVLVSVSDVQELREAYPSYFLNAYEFIQALDAFELQCKYIDKLSMH